MQLLSGSTINGVGTTWILSECLQGQSGQKDVEHLWWYVQHSQIVLTLHFCQKLYNCCFLFTSTLGVRYFRGAKQVLGMKNNYINVESSKNVSRLPHFLCTLISHNLNHLPTSDSSNLGTSEAFRVPVSMWDLRCSTRKYAAIIHCSWHFGGAGSQCRTANWIRTTNFKDAHVFTSISTWLLIQAVREFQ